MSSSTVDHAEGAGAILVLGGRIAPNGRLTSLLARRIDTAVTVATRFPDALVVACGGRSWEGFVEADVMARALMERSIPEARIVRERVSLTTVENLREGFAHARNRGKTGRIAIVTCDWHLPRALSIAQALGIDALGVPARGGEASLFTRVMRRVHEAIALRLDRVRVRVG